MSLALIRLLSLCDLFFFFSSRRRHTRCLSDWSSDVCSSDLRLRFNAPEIGLLVLHTRGNLEAAAALGNQLASADDNWFIRETRSLVSRTLRQIGRASCRERV